MNMNVSKTNGVKLLAVVAVLAMVACAFAVVMPAEETEAASTTPTEIGGGLTPVDNKFVLQTYTTGEVVVLSDFIIPDNTALVVDGAKFTVNEGVTITVQAGGQLVFLSGDITINGDIVATGTDPATENTKYGYLAAIVNNVTVDTPTGQKAMALNGNITLERGAEMTAVSQGVIGNTDAETDGVDKYTTSEATSGALSLAEGASINVTKRSSGISAIENQNILLNQGATFSTNGHINNVTVAATANTTYYTAGAVSINTDGYTNYYRTGDASGEYTDIRETSNLTFTVTSESTPALIKTATDSEKYQQITLRQFIVNVEGTVDAGDHLSFDEGDSFYTGTTYKTAWDSTGVYYVDTDDNVADPDKKIVPMTSVTGNLVVTDYNGKYKAEGEEQPYNSTVAVNGYVSVSGTITAQYSKESGGTSTQASVSFAPNKGIAYVTGSITMNFASISTETVNQGSIIVDGGNITIAGANVTTLAGMGFYVSAAMYTVETTTGEATTYLCDFDDAVAGAAEANVSEVFVFASGYTPLGATYCGTSDTYTDAEDAIENGATVIDADLTITADMEITIVHGFVVAEGATLTLSEGVIVNIGMNTITGIVFVDGKIVDNDETMAGYDGADNFVYEVKKTAETETSVIATYTTLKIALGEAQPGEEIQLNGQVTIKENLTIPADVTVITGPNGTSPDTDALTLVGATLTINGTLEVADEATIAITTNAETDVESKIIVNNVIKNATPSTDETTAGTFNNGNDKPADVPGAYFQGQIGEDEEGTLYVTSVAVAGTASTTVNGNITIIGAVNMGDVTFTQGENNDLKIIVKNAGDTGDVKTKEVATAGTVTLVGADFELQGAFTGTVQSEVSAGMTAVAFDEGNKAAITFVENNDGTTTTTEMVLSSTDATVFKVDGTVTIAQGTVYINAEFDIAMLTVASGATLEVGTAGNLITDMNPDYKWVANPSLPIDTQGEVKSCAGLVVAGTANIAGTVDADVAYISGTLNLTEDAKNCEIGGLVDGTLAAAEGAKATIGVLLVNGTVTGIYGVTPVPAQNPEDEVLGTIIVAYPGSDVTGAIFNDNGNGESNMNTTAFYINGAAVGTIYTNNDAISVQYILAFVDVPGVIYDSEDGKKDPKYYSDEAMLNEIKTPANAYIGENYPAVYIEMQPSTVTGKISAVQGMTIYIDGLGLKNFESKTGDGYDLTVGDHYITVQVTPGYSATPVITFNGQTVTDGKITITGEMKEFTLLASGDVSVDTGATGGDGMGLTEILLIILVVLIVVMRS